MSCFNRWMSVPLAAAICGGVSGAANAAPVISIGGLTGAEHWVWQEGEDDYTAPNAGSAAFRDNADVSGWMTAGPANAYRRATGSLNVRTVTWTLQAPAAMSSESKIFTRASINKDDVGMTVTVDSTVVADRMLTSGLTNPTVFLEHKLNGQTLGQGVPVGSLTAGSHTASYAAESYSVQQFASFMVDGVLLYDGTPVLPGVSAGSRNWLLNPSSADSPELADPVTPVLNVTGLVDGNVVQYLLDGAVYTPGTEIGAGDHELVVAVWQDASATSKRLAFAGANFTVVPEPASLLLVAGGVVAMLSSRESR